MFVHVWYIRPTVNQPLRSNMISAVVLVCCFCFVLCLCLYVILRPLSTYLAILVCGILWGNVAGVGIVWYVCLPRSINPSNTIYTAIILLLLIILLVLCAYSCMSPQLRALKRL